jgi:alpha-D-xyloside xylohydrolase
MKKSDLSSAIAVCLLLVLAQYFAASAESLANYASHETSGRSVLVTSSSGQKLRLTPYGDYMVRVQAVESGKDFFADDRWEIIPDHDMGGELAVEDGGDYLELQTGAGNGVLVRLTKSPMRLAFYLKDGPTLMLEEADNGMDLTGMSNKGRFKLGSGEHFAGLGHNTYGRTPKIDYLTQTNVFWPNAINSPQLVPFYVSARGYGVYVHTTFKRRFNFANGNYGFEIFSTAVENRLDFFFIAGPEIMDIIDRYTSLTGRPFFPPLSFLGMALSDKHLDNQCDETWWKQAITSSRNQGWPVDGSIFDNSWRGGRCGVAYAWRYDRWPNPAEYGTWCRNNGISTMFDWNSCITNLTAGWNNAWATFGGWPDFSNPAMCNWFWNTLWDVSLKPEMPGNMVWLDEFEGPPENWGTRVNDGQTIDEYHQHYFFLMNKCVYPRWEEEYGNTRRFVCMTRGASAGCQRWTMMWTGDINGTYEEMRNQLPGMLNSGISGFPYWSHDPGGHWAEVSDDMYRKWTMAMASFTPYWRPHGQGGSRWPKDKNPAVQQVARKYVDLRYNLMPYNYTYLRLSHTKGAPMARAMFLEPSLQDNATAWSRDHQWFWGKEFLVAPNTGASPVNVWLPPGNWYNYWSDEKFAGNRELSVNDNDGSNMPLFVREGAVIPMHPVCMGVKWMHRDTLMLHVYTGSDGTFELYEDDGETHMHREGQFMTTAIQYCDEGTHLLINAAEGTYEGAPEKRTYQVYFHGLEAEPELTVENDLEDSRRWDGGKGVQHVATKPVALNERVDIYNRKVCQSVSIGPAQAGLSDIRPAAVVVTQQRGKAVLNVNAAPHSRVVAAAYDMTGRQVLARELPRGAGVFTVDTHRLVGGVYVLRVLIDGRCARSVRLNNF